MGLTVVTQMPDSKAASIISGNSIEFGRQSAMTSSSSSLRTVLMRIARALHLSRSWENFKERSVMPSTWNNFCLIRCAFSSNFNSQSRLFSAKTGNLSRHTDRWIAPDSLKVDAATSRHYSHPYLMVAHMHAMHNTLSAYLYLKNHYEKLFWTFVITS